MTDLKKNSTGCSVNIGHFFSNIFVWDFAKDCQTFLTFIMFLPFLTFLTLILTNFLPLWGYGAVYGDTYHPLVPDFAFNTFCLHRLYDTSWSSFLTLILTVPLLLACVLAVDPSLHWFMIMGLTNLLLAMRPCCCEATPLGCFARRRTHLHAKQPKGGQQANPRGETIIR